MSGRSNLLRLLAIVGGGVAVLFFYLSRYPLGAFRTPLGDDANVYLWWSNLSGLRGLSVSGWRPGVPALVLALDVLPGSRMEIVAGIGAALAAAAAMVGGAIALAKQDRRATWVVVLAVVLVGCYAGHLAAGYLANLALVVALLAVVALLGDGSSAWAATVVLAAGALAHPMFFAAGVVILVLAAAFSGGEARSRVGVVAGGATALAAVGLATMMLGPRPPVVDTSADALLRRSNGWSTLRTQYRLRLRWQLGWYLAWLFVPLGLWGRGAAEGLTRRLLDAWLVVCGVGFVVSWASGWLPPLRWLAFAFALPVLAALSFERLRALAPGSVLPWVAIALLVGLVVWQTAAAWSRVQPTGTPAGIAAVEDLGRTVNGSSVGTPFVVVTGGTAAEVLALGNLVRAYLPPERIADLHLFAGSIEELRRDEATATDDLDLLHLSRTLLADLHGASVDPTTVAAYQLPILPAAHVPSSWSLVAIGAGILLLWMLVGFGWSRAVTSDVGLATALAPAFGMVALMLVAFLVDRLGVRLSGLTPAFVTTAASLGGYGAWAWRARTTRAPGASV